jgi:hypothetical protein
MLQILQFYTDWMIIVPLFLTILTPVYQIDAQQYMEKILYNVAQIKHKITYDNRLIKKGFVLANHRSWTDFCIDSYTAKASILGRKLAFCAVFGVTSINHLSNRNVMFTRGKDTRRDIYDKCVKHIQKSDYKRVVFFPEGTRMTYTTLNSVDEVKSYLKYGLLKEIYYDKRFPVQIMISNNKEIVFNEKTMTINYGVQVNTHISKPIWPKDFQTETEFFDAIANQWYESWKKTHTIV